MKALNFDHLKRESVTTPRSNREMLIEQIVEQTTGSAADKKKLAKVLAINSKILKWSETDLHALLGKKKDPSIRNYTAFVWYSLKLKSK